MRKTVKRGLALLLAGTMLFSLAGHGKNEESGSERERKEFYYVPEYKNLDLEVDYINQTAAIDNQLYLLGNSWNNETGESKTLMYQYDLLTGECKEFPIDLGEHASVQQIGVNSAGNLMMVVDKYIPIDELADTEDGTEETAENAGEEAKSEEVAEDGNEAAESDEASEETEDGEETAEGTAVAPTGNVIINSGEGVVMVSETSALGEAVSINSSVETEYENYLDLYEISPSDGSILNQIDMKPLLEGQEQVWIQQMAIDDKDNIYISDGNSSIHIMDKTGKKLGSITLDNWVDNLFATEDGTVYVKKWGNEGQELRPIDLQTKSLGEAVKGKIISEGGGRYNQNYFSGKEGGLIVSDSKGVFTYDITSDTKEDLFDWLDVDINSDEVQKVGELSDGRFWAILREYGGESSEYSLVYLTKTPASQVQEKEEILYGTMWLDQSARKNIIDFNKSSEKYHISVKEYAADDYMAGLTQFNNDITSGKCPDIMALYSINFEQYASKGVFEDLYPYMEKEGIQKSDYLENVFKAYEMDEKLYGIVPQFYIATTIAKASKVGNEPGWTLKEMLDFAENSNAENIFQYGSRESIFYYCIYNNIDEFIDWETGKCNFTGEDFIRTLEFAAKYPEEADYNQDDEGISTKLRNDKLLLMQTSISSVQEYQMMRGLFGEEITYIGYPNSERKGNLIQPTNGSMALSAKSKHKEGAWEFIKTVLSEEYQKDLVQGHGGNWGFPIMKSALDEQFEKDMTPDYYTDENGERVESPKTTWSYDSDFEMEIYAATKEEVDTVRELITSAEKASTSINQELSNIITEETASFFKGQKSAKETADIIQNRVQIYVNENR